MTADELAAIVDGLAPIVRELRDRATQRSDALAVEVHTVRESLRAAEGRRVELETRTQALEQHIKALRLELEAVRA